VNEEIRFITVNLLCAQDYLSGWSRDIREVHAVGLSQI
jgi:hypothetical protein